MRRIRIPIALLLFVLGTSIAGADPAPSSDPTRVMVKLDDGSWEPRTLSEDASPEMLGLAQRSGALVLEPVRVYRQFEASSTPSDPSFPAQWHLQRNQAVRSWRLGDGSGVTVAVIDSGVGSTSDLACHSYVSPYDFRTQNATVPPDANGHGTFVTAILAECTDNGLAGAGTAPGVSVMPLGVLSSQGVTTTDLLYQALYWALDHDADIVNLSLGFSCDEPYPGCSDTVIDSAIADLTQAGVVIVAATGNDGTGAVSYPANHPDVVAVGASGYDGRRADYSSFGSGITLVAPTGDGNDPANRDGVIHQGLFGVEIGTGTSYSTPQVSGALAILRSAGFPSMGHALTGILQSSEDISPSGYDSGTGYGDLRIRDALAWGGVGVTPPIEDAAYHGAGDFNNDGRSDLVSYDGRYGRWWVLRSNGTGLIPAEWARFSTVSGWTTRLAGDFNGDNRTDIANFHPSNGTWWVNRSTGTSFSLSVWADYATPTGWGTRLVGDFNGDGRDDIADYHTATGGWWISRGNANNTFTTTRWADFATSSGWKTHIVGDFNGDGRDDIASFHPSNGTWWVSRGNANNTFTTVQWADYTTASGWTTQIAGDFNNDGRDDIANFHPSNGTWWVSRSTGGGFTTPALWADYTTATGWTNQMTGDFTGDGRDDIANYYPGNGTWWISRSTGTTFTNPALWADFTTLTGWGIRLIGDYNNDGRDDIANYHQDGIWVVSRSGGTSFSTTAWFD